jgi:prolyl oligopeptidase
MTVEGIELGRYLFYDGRIAGTNHPDSMMSCATCHLQERSFEVGIDHPKYADGFTFGVTGIHTPHVMLPLINLVWNHNGYLWNGYVHDNNPNRLHRNIEALTIMSIMAPHEMNSDTNKSKQMIGKYWATDYGTSEDSKEMFEYLVNYSPIHSIKSGVEYPATLVTTADHDDRVVPAHSFKYIATLQENYQGGKNPVMIRIETKAGHGAGKSTEKIIEEYSDLWAFMMYNMGVEPAY